MAQGAEVVYKLGNIMGGWRGGGRHIGQFSSKSCKIRILQFKFGTD